jgi:hypothetical protein
LLLGYMVATQLGGFLGIEFIAKDLPADVAPDAVAPSQEQASKETPLNPVAAIVLPPGALQDDLYVRAADALADAVAMRTSQRPQIVEAGSEQPAGRRIVVGAQTAPELASAKPESAESSTYMPFATASGQQSLGVVGGGTRQELKHAGYKVQARSSGLKRASVAPAGGYHMVAGWVSPSGGRPQR